ncbi:hypothetical protein [Pseudoxanthomonas kaohsiungensis]|uniref:Uncharacterized protein n=1 Tax=Pseudoxanthomonas kaohsiungensis TaxID=283923 RepID=A0ABW3LXG6_9GAMM|nr:hypothetical protein [Pseudoxanthomonas kaohsiungensis]KAF1702943.1 hypothetical protein CSC66_09210 [Pseudoxanthomonas kaohsiungensis]
MRPAISAIQQLFQVLPAARGAGPEAPYLRLQAAEGAVVADLEYRPQEDGWGAVLQIAVVDRSGAPEGSPRAVVAGVFCLASGQLLRSGQTVSLAVAPEDPAGALSELLASMEGLQAHPSPTER